MSEFNKHVGKFIEKDKAEKMKKNWKKTGIVTQSNFVGSDILFQLLNTPNVVGIRIHHAMDDDGTMQPILTAEFDSTVATTATSSTNTGPVDATLACPPYCP